ncbi:MAG: mechanosensitive ion channel [Myxococcota bacterium]|jgi:small-conductance mechanosensitive channel|nr:mechanosensitive ion channel [Myxococcota bacterium]
MNDFFEREPLGFDADTFSTLGTRLSAAAEAISDGLTRFSEASFGGKLLALSPFLLLALGVAGLLFFDRRLARWRERWLAARQVSPRQALLNACLAVSIRLLPPAVLLLLAYIFDAALSEPSTLILLSIELLWLLLAARFLRGIARVVLNSELVHYEQAPRRLWRWFDRGIIGAILLMAVSTSLTYFDDALDLHAFAVFVTRVGIAGYVLLLLPLKAELSVIIPSIDASAVYRSFRAAFLREFRPFVIAVALMVGLWAAGFNTAAINILLRGLGVLVLLFAGWWLFRATMGVLGRWLERQQRAATEAIDLEHQRLLRSLERNLVVMASILMGWGGLSILGVWDWLVELLSYPFFTVFEHVEISVYGIALAIFVGWMLFFVSIVIRVLLNEKAYPRFEIDVGVGYAINTMVLYALLCIGFLLAIRSFGIDLSSIALFMSALGVGIGFGLQGLVHNLISGMLLLFGRSVRKGDWVTAASTFGRVDRVGARSVTSTTPDHYEMIIPSSDLINQPIINWTLSSGVIRVAIPVGVSYLADPHQVREVLLEAATQHPKVLTRPTPMVFFEAFGESSIDFTLFVFVDCRTITERRLRGELNFHIWDALKRNNIEIPFPQRDLHIRSVYPSMPGSLPVHLEGGELGLRHPRSGS